MKLISLLFGCAALVAVCPAVGWSAEAGPEQVPQVRILFLGNSYMAINGLPAMVGELLLSSKLLAPHIASSLQPNYTLERHTTHAEGLALMKQGADDGKPWDVIVVQEHSVVSATAAVDADARLLMENGLSKIVKHANELNPKVLVVVMQVWARHENLWKARDADALITGASPGEAHVRCHVANLKAVAAVREGNPGARILVSPVGDFWWLVHDLYPALPLHAEDGSHPDTLGTLLSAYVIAGSIGGREVIEQATWRPPDCPAVEVERVRKMILDHPEVFKAAAR